MPGRIDADMAKADAATKRPWVIEDCDGQPWSDGTISLVGVGRLLADIKGAGLPGQRANAAYMIAAANGYPEALRLLKRSELACRKGDGGELRRLADAIEAFDTGEAT
ncbi:hypothetical protein LCGC14_2328880 [marine sediment metagenome]|uniref:Uncharacterized protein n=1 Tax=marine sediment metagenome TaxID=412755 RepID=A0A0F9ET48_9ZZZZ